MRVGDRDSLLSLFFLFFISYPPVSFLSSAALLAFLCCSPHGSSRWRHGASRQRTWSFKTRGAIGALLPLCYHTHTLYYHTHTHIHTMHISETLAPLHLTQSCFCATAYVCARVFSGTGSVGLM